MVKKRKSKYEIEDFDKEMKEFKRLKSMAHSLRKLGNLYARKEEVLYKNMNKLKYDKPYILSQHNLHCFPHPHLFTLFLCLPVNFRALSLLAFSDSYKLARVALVIHRLRLSPIKFIS